MNLYSDEIQRQIHARGGRLTSQRQAILAALGDLGGHPTAEELFLQARRLDPSINLSTIYRNLHWLEEHGLINPMWFDEERRQQRFDPARPSDHQHFRCLSCGVIIEFVEPSITRIQSAFEAAHHARIESTNLVLYGTCARCQKDDS